MKYLWYAAVTATTNRQAQRQRPIDKPKTRTIYKTDQSNASVLCTYTSPAPQHAHARHSSPPQFATQDSSPPQFAARDSLPPQFAAAVCTVNLISRAVSTAINTKCLHNFGQPCSVRPPCSEHPQLRPPEASPWFLWNTHTSPPEKPALYIRVLLPKPQLS